MQNYKLATDQTPAGERIKINNRDFARAMPGDPAGIDPPAVFAAFQRIGFDGWATVMCDCPAEMDPKDLARQWADYLRPLG